MWLDRRFLIALSLLLSKAPSLHALTMGNPAEPQIIEKGFWIDQDCSIGVKLGYEGDRVTDRKMRTQGREHGRIDTTKLSFDQAVVTLNYLDRLEIYGSLGSMQARLSHRRHLSQGDEVRVKYQTHNGWLSGVGGRLLLTQWNRLVLGVEGKIQYGNPKMEWTSLNGVLSKIDGHFKYWEWQISFAFAYTVDWLTPYIGAKYSNAHVSMRSTPHHMVSRDFFGMAIGFTLSPSKKFDLFAEVQLIDEQAVSFGGTARF